MTENGEIAVIPGDGIGPEVTEQALRVVSAVASGFQFHHYDLGAERYLRTGEVLPAEVRDELEGVDAIFLGAVGDPRVEPGVLERGLLINLRQSLDLFVNLRPAKRFPGVPAPLPKDSNFDVIIVRENTEGLYAGGGRTEGAGTPEEQAIEISVNTRGAVERIVDYAYRTARELERPLTLVHKTNVLIHSGGLYQRVFDEKAKEFTDVKTDYQNVDAAALLMASDPERFSVVVTDNAFGDILSDLAAGLAGGIGFVGSANLNPAKTSLFEPVHGSAPGIAGMNRANPLGAILSGAMMLRHLGKADEAAAIETAVSSGASRVAREELGTTQTGDLVVAAMS